MSDARRRAEMYLKGRTWEFAAGDEYLRDIDRGRNDKPRSNIPAHEYIVEPPAPPDLNDPRMVPGVLDKTRAAARQAASDDLVDSIIDDLVGNVPHPETTTYAQKSRRGQLYLTTREEYDEFERVRDAWVRAHEQIKLDPVGAAAAVAREAAQRNYDPAVVARITSDPQILSQAIDAKVAKSEKEFRRGDPEAGRGGFAPVPERPGSPDVDRQIARDYASEQSEQAILIAGKIAADIAAIDAKIAQPGRTFSAQGIDEVRQLQEQRDKLHDEWERALIRARQLNPNDELFQDLDISPEGVRKFLENVHKRRSDAASEYRAGIGAASPFSAGENIGARIVGADATRFDKTQLSAMRAFIDDAVKSGAVIQTPQGFVIPSRPDIPPMKTHAELYDVMMRTGGNFDGSHPEVPTTGWSQDQIGRMLTGGVSGGQVPPHVIEEAVRRGEIVPFEVEVPIEQRDAQGQVVARTRREVRYRPGPTPSPSIRQAHQRAKSIMVARHPEDAGIALPETVPVNAEAYLDAGMIADQITSRYSPAAQAIRRSVRDARRKFGTEAAADAERRARDYLRNPTQPANPAPHEAAGQTREQFLLNQKRLLADRRAGVPPTPLPSPPPSPDQSSLGPDDDPEDWRFRDDA